MYITKLNKNPKNLIQSHISSNCNELVGKIQDQISITYSLYEYVVLF